MSARAWLGSATSVGVLAIGLLVAGCGGGTDGGGGAAGEATLAPPASHADASAGLPAGTPPSPPRPDANTVRWTTASEVSNYGYDIYRGDTPDGPFERISERPVQGAGTTDAPTRYEFVDDSIAPGREYYYYVESIALDGTRRRFTPVRRAAPKPGRQAASRTEGEEEQQAGGQGR